MVRSFVAVSAAFIQFALVARISTGLPMLPVADMPESQVLSKRKEQQLSKRMTRDGIIACVTASGIVAVVVANLSCRIYQEYYMKNFNSRRRALARAQAQIHDHEMGLLPSSEATRQQHHGNGPRPIPPPVTRPPAAHLAGNGHSPSIQAVNWIGPPPSHQGHSGAWEHEGDAANSEPPPPPYTPHANPHKRSELLHIEEVEERNVRLARGFYIDELD